MRLERRNTMVLALLRYLYWFESYLRKTVNPQIALFLPDLEGSKYNLNRSARVPLNLKYPEHSSGLCPTVLYQ